MGRQHKNNSRILEMPPFYTTISGGLAGPSYCPMGLNLPPNRDVLVDSSVFQCILIDYINFCMNL